ncbi:MAG: PilZ domain-containing protein [bacterium]
MAEKNYKQRKERKSFGLPIIISVGEEQIKLPARLNNMSEGGLSFKSNVLFPNEETVEIFIPYPDYLAVEEQVSPIVINVKIVWSKDFKDENDPLIRYVHGCQFVSDESNKHSKGIMELIKLSEKIGQRPMGF